MASSKPVGFKLSFANAKTNPKNKNLLKPQNGQPPAKKARLLGHDEPEEDLKSVEISGWDTTAGGAVEKDGKKEEEKKPLVIPSLPNRNWMGHKERKDGGKSEKNDEGVKKEEDYPEEEVHYGLTFIKKGEGDGDVVMEDAPKSEQPQDDGLTEEQRLEKRALDALLHGKPTAEQNVIPAQNEEEAFEHDYENAPEAPSLDDYAAVPVEGYGAALLRGMGWKDGEEVGRKKGQKAKPREVKRRPAGLGIGAKVENAVDLEMAEWGRPKGGKVPTYNPVVLKNTKTGEMISEEELKQKIERQKMVGESGDGEWESGRSKDKERRREKYDDYEDEDERRERKRNEKERERRDRDRSPRRTEQSRDKDRDRDRDRRRDDGYDSRDRKERSRDRDSGRKDRRRDHDYYSDKKRDSRRDYSDDERRREKRRDRDRERGRRDRSRSPDSEDRRKRRRDYEDEPDDRKRRHRDDDYRRK